MMELIPLNENGHALSPILPENVKNYLIDIDGTICDDIPNEEPERMLTAAVYPEALVTLNKFARKFKNYTDKYETDHDDDDENLSNIYVFEVN